MRIVVVGAGYAGTMAANRLARKVKSADITVLNPRPDFVERVRLHQQVAGTRVVAAPVTSMLRPGISTRIGTADKIGDGTIALRDGDRIDFDYAFLAVGSTVRPIPGTIPVGTWEGAEQARTALASLAAGSSVTVVGGGLTGIETAAEIAYARPDLRVRLVGSTIGGNFSERPRQRVHAGLRRLKVDLVEDDVIEIGEGTGQFDGLVHLRSGAAFPADLILWGIVAAVPDLAARSGLEVDAKGRAIVDKFLRSVTDKRVFVVGDCAAVPGARFACQTAGPQGYLAANNLARLLSGGTPKPYAVKYIARAVTLGRKDAVDQFTRPDDTLRRAYLTGRTGAVVKEMAGVTAKLTSRMGVSA